MFGVFSPGYFLCVYAVFFKKKKKNNKKVSSELYVIFTFAF